MKAEAEDNNISSKTLKNRRKRERRRKKYGLAITILQETADAFDNIDVSKTHSSPVNRIRNLPTSHSKRKAVDIKEQEENIFAHYENKPTKQKSPVKSSNLTVNLKANSSPPKKVCLNPSHEQSPIGPVVRKCSPKNFVRLNTKSSQASNSSSYINSSEERDEIVKHRKSLPVFNVKHEITQIIFHEKCSIFVGDTGCGKTTQVPQYLLWGGLLKNKAVAVTQPRRVAAITIAEQVSKEVGTSLGGKVGYCVRFEDVTSAATKIKYVTDGMLLRESISDPLLLNYSIIILDEAHERTLHTDVLFGIVKAAQKNREEIKEMPLKIIIMSATLDYDHFSKYFNDAAVYHLRGREYSIKILNTLKTQEDYIFSTLVTVVRMHQDVDKGDILVFCTGQEDITYMVNEIKQIALELPYGCDKLHACALYAALPSHLQREVFKPCPEGIRKVIFATNIAETSVTIPGVKYVVDTGMVKARSYNPSSGLDLLKVQRISKAQADQRAGRAGREFDGACYRLYTLEEFENFRDHAIPEIQRCSLAGVILQIAAIGIRNVRKFDFLDKPSEENIDSAIEQLKLLGAVQEKGDKIKLTECGKKMVNFPLDPQFSKILLASQNLKCTDEILTILSLLSVESIFFTPLNELETYSKVRRKFSSEEGDHIMLLNVYKTYRSISNDAKAWCRENYVNFKSMKKVIEIRKQLRQLCERLGITNCSCGKDTARVRRCLAVGLFMNSAQLRNNKAYITLANNQKVSIHPTSCLFSSKPSLCIYTELVETSKCYMRNISVVDADWLKEAAPSYFANKRFIGYQLTAIDS